MLEKFRKFVTIQFGNPSGLLGKLMGERMAKGNLYDAQWTLSLLDIQPQDNILEIGFGPGVSTQLASEKASKGFVAGIDHSKAMVQVASQRNAAAIQAGLMELKQAEVSSLPYPDQSFDLVFSLHSIYFWPKPVDCLTEIKRVLKPDGLLAITIQPKDKWRPQVDINIMTLYFGREVATLFSEAGYRDIRVEASLQPGKRQLECILSVK
jgi:ubiquinone/menaquinone biosynthesis C-methylase UbiE